MLATHLKQKVFYPAGPGYIGLAGIYLERNDLEKAEETSNGGWNFAAREPCMASTLATS